MEDLSLHILDIVENATKAGAILVEIEITEDKEKDLLRIVIRDNGHGMDEEMARMAYDPFITTRTTRRVGLGLALLNQATREAGGDLSIKSEPGSGTEVVATFLASHIDRKPMGDMGSSMISLIAGNPDVDFLYESVVDDKRTTLDTREIRAQIEGITTMDNPVVLRLIRDILSQNPDEVTSKNGGD